MANIFKIAKKVQRQHKSWDWQRCIREARKIMPQTGKSNTAIDKKVKAKKPGKRKSASGKVYYERRKNRSDVPGTMTGIRTDRKRLAINRKREDVEYYSRAMSNLAYEMGKYPPISSMNIKKVASLKRDYSMAKKFRLKAERDLKRLLK